MIQNRPRSQIGTERNIGPAIDRSLAEGVLSTPTDDTPVLTFAEEYPLRAHEGNVKQFERYENLTPAVDELVGGYEPAPEAPRKNYVEARVTWRGRSVLVTQQQVYFDQSNVIANIMMRLGVAKNLGQGVLLTELLMNAVNVYTCSGGTNSSDNPTRMSVQDELNITTIHRRNNSMPYLRSVDSGMGEGTVPINPSYVGIVPSDAHASFPLLTGFIRGAQYGQAQNRVGWGELGQLGNHRFFLTNQNRPSSTLSRGGNMIGTGFSFGKEAYAHLVSDATTAQIRLNDPYTRSIHGTTIPLHVTYKFASCILQEEYVLRFRFTF